MYILYNTNKVLVYHCSTGIKNILRLRVRELIFHNLKAVKSDYCAYMKCMYVMYKSYVMCTL